MKKLKLVVFERTSTGITPIGMIFDYIMLSYTPQFNDLGNFKLIVPFSQETFQLVMPINNVEKIIHLDDGHIGLIYMIDYDSSKQQLTLSGTLGSGLLDQVIVGLVSLQEDTPIQTIIDQTYNDTEPYSKADSRVPFSEAEVGEMNESMKGSKWAGLDYELNEDITATIEAGFFGGRSTYARFLQQLCKSCDKGYETKYNFETNRIYFRLLDSQNHTITSESPVVISQKFNNLKSSKFSLNLLNYKNKIYGWSETEYNNETYEGTYLLDGWWVNYQDTNKRPSTKQAWKCSYEEIQGSSEIPHYIPPWVQLPSTIYSQGQQLLYDYNAVKSFEIELDEATGPVFGMDYNFGDTLTIQDIELGYTMDAQLLEYTITYDIHGRHFEPVFGISQPSITKVLKNKKIIV